ncbi:MAG TPA: helicase-related protein [Acidimicrobiales bacterium]|nr:helicase-related protein [Acidimicrobiales bacterium]
MSVYAPGALVAARGREWVVLPGSDDDLLVLRPLGGGPDDTAAVLPALEEVVPASFAPPGSGDLGDGVSAWMLRAALRTGFRSSGGPFRSLAGLAVEPRAYQYVPLMLALRQSPVRLLIGDDVGIGKTIEAGLIAAELIAQGDVRRLAVLASPALAEQWQAELATKFGIDAVVVLPSTAARLSRGLMLNESLFDRHPFVVVSTDFIKMPARRAEFLNHCPELVIVDEVHNAVADGASPLNAGTAGHAARTQRYDLLQRVAADPARHVVLVTATPHSGKEAGFRNLLGLLDPSLASVDLEKVTDRVRLARHFVQRRRADIRRYLSEDTVFPSDRLTKEAPYHLSPEYAAFANRLLEYARGRVSDDAGTPLHRRVRWWSALALLRAMASSPAAAAATLRTRASALGANTPEEADAIGRAAVLDHGTEDSLEGADTAPGADLSDGADDDDTDYGAEAASPGRREHRRLVDLARAAEALEGTGKDRKLGALIDEVKELLAEGADPIVFCRFLATADYVAEELGRALAKARLEVQVAAVTGELPPAVREARIAELVAAPGRHVLVATDCLSEGVNLQEHFQAVVHYDLAWNPTRHEQREGRVDRFGQRADIVRAVTIYGLDNGVDRIVLDVLVRKHEAIRRDTGVSVPVPDESDNVVEALVTGLVLAPSAGRGRQLSLGFDPNEQLSLDLDLAAGRDKLHQAWESAAAREHASRTKYAQEAVHPEEVLREVTAARAALGDREEVAELSVKALAALGAPVRGGKDKWTIDVSAIPSALRESLPAGLVAPLVLHRDLPVPAGHAVADRSDPTVEAVARYVLDTALDPLAPHRVASRAGAVRTSAVARRTTLVLLRARLHLDLPGATGLRQMVAEEARLAAFAGPATAPEWLDDEATTALLAARPDGNIDPEQAAQLLGAVTDNLSMLSQHFDTVADQLAREMLDAHRRVRVGANAPLRGLAVRAQHPVDVLGVYLYLPLPAR